MFDKTKTISTTPKKASSKPETPTTTILGVFAYTCLDTAISTLEALRDVYEKKIKDSAVKHWIKEGMAAKARPLNFKGAEGSARVDFNLKQRPSNSAICAADAELCDKAGIPLTTEVKQQAAWVLNPEIAADPEKLEQIVKALKKLPYAQDLFLYQEEVSCKVVKDDAIQAIFKLEKEEEVKSFIDLLCVVSAKPTQENPEEAFKHVAKLTPEAVTLAKQEANKAAVPKTVDRKVKVKEPA